MEQSILQERSALFAATLTSFMNPFMVSAVNVALPAIQAELSMDAVQLSWVATAYLLAVAVCLVPVGKLADIKGRKKIFVSGLMVHTVSAVATMFVPSPSWFIALRVAQGLGAAMFVTTGMAILSSVFPVQRRGRAIGVYVAAVYVGLSVGPFAGGLLTQHLGWRSIFILMLPLGASSIFVSIKFIQAEWTDAQGQRLDWLGSLLYAAAICALIYGATLLPSANAWKIMAAGLVVLIAFVLQELRAPHPVFDLSLFKSNRTFTFSSLAALINYAATYAITFMISLYLQYIKGMTPQQAGTILFAQPVVMAFLSPLAGRLADRVEPRWIASTGMALTVLGLAGFSLIGPGTGNVYIVANLIVLGLGFGLFSSPNMSAIMGAVDQQYYGVASGTVATMRVLGQMSSMAIATVALSIFIGRDPIQPANYGLFIRSVHTVFTILALVCTAGVFFSLARGRLRR